MKAGLRPRSHISPTTGLQVPLPGPTFWAQPHICHGHKFRHVSCAVLYRSHDCIASPLNTAQAPYCFEPICNVCHNGEAHP